MKIICDFDGTTALNDVGNLLFRTFADQRCFDIVRSWKEGKISSKECLIQECTIARATRAQLEAFADAQALDPHFVEFVQFCRGHDVEVAIASDGLDFYIERILRNHDVHASVQVCANHLVFVGEDRLRPEFPYFEAGCGQCGNCKGYHVRQAKQDGSVVVYVGDGFSDRCGADAADIAFAKRGRELLHYCKRHHIPHHEYANFGEILPVLEEIVSNRAFGR
ncbi:MAG: MtnX-like HAD-IB family phosphatase [bacterium]